MQHGYESIIATLSEEKLSAIRSPFAYNGWDWTLDEEEIASYNPEPPSSSGPVIGGNADILYNQMNVQTVQTVRYGRRGRTCRQSIKQILILHFNFFPNFYIYIRIVFDL